MDPIQSCWCRQEAHLHRDSQDGKCSRDQLAKRQAQCDVPPPPHGSQLTLENLLFPHPHTTHQSPKDIQTTQEKYPPLLHHLLPNIQTQLNTDHGVL